MSKLVELTRKRQDLEKKLNSLITAEEKLIKEINKIREKITKVDAQIGVLRR